ncbi:hypothetical protein OE88DRAFT_1737365 [Heliocybe sulcata]|uniref:Uncharacterized protein n=1 Tax=Heliocybe sulcata TaxID=5364 RepID=A0A5C3MUK7_9AGAM|nr:hypothetical protein OE88DRAFT_1737365 [Heliocybe sulcata]
MSNTGTRGQSFGGRTAGGGSKTLWGGIVVVSAGCLGFWYSLGAHHESKQADPVNGGRVPTWEYRIQQAQAPADSAENPATLRTPQGDENEKERKSQ